MQLRSIFIVPFPLDIVLPKTIIHLISYSFEECYDLKHSGLASPAKYSYRLGLNSITLWV